MGILSNISGKEAVRVFKKIGYYLDHQESSHMILYNERPGYPLLSIPDHKELAPGLLSAQIKRAKLTIKQFNNLRRRRKHK
ncbi:type II toxin-antitoxin system HicA family toxin [Patescibacteria group bacterium AH-259-L05]|nr:type II toxin-antitoxin system HicA family toxin [Patescibacteria group bacterium AH-259-L05]